MKLTLCNNWLTVRASFKKERHRNESALYYGIKQELNKRGFDVIKRCPGRDGHLFSASYYIRDRKWRFCFTDDNYAIRDLAKEFNAKGVVELRRTDWSDDEKQCP